MGGTPDIAWVAGYRLRGFWFFSFGGWGEGAGGRGTMVGGSCSLFEWEGKGREGCRWMDR